MQKSIAEEILEQIETKNSWGKNELKEMLLRILVKRPEEKT